MLCIVFWGFLSDEKPPPMPVLVTLRSIAKETEFITATTEIYVGCVRTMAVSQKKVSTKTPLLFVDYVYATFCGDIVNAWVLIHFRL